MVSNGWAFEQNAGGRDEFEGAVSIDADLLCAIETELDVAGVRAGGNFEIEFNFAVMGVVNDVDAGVDLRPADAGVVGDIGAPVGGVRAEVVVGDSGEFVRRGPGWLCARRRDAWRWRALAECGIAPGGC